MRNSEIAARIRELGDLYELDGAISYRVLAYRQAAKAVADAPVSIEQLATQGRLTEVPGIGKTIAEKIGALLAEGEIPAALKLKERIPSSLVELLAIPGLGARTIRLINAELGVSSLAELRTAVESGALRGLKGMGPKAEENILRGIEAVTSAADAGPAWSRRLLPDVLAIAEPLAAELRAHPAADQVEIAGSARRLAESCKDIDLIASSESPEELIDVFCSNELIDEVRSRGVAGASALTHLGISVDLRIGGPEVFGNLLQHFTGSQAHNVALREDAASRGLKVSEHGIERTEEGSVTHCRTEAEVYEELGYAYIAPELREGRGELKAARDGALPDLIEIGDLRGDLHCHTTLSDGRNSLPEMAAAAKALGYGYLAVTDHSATHGFGDHVTPQALEERIEEVHALDGELKRFRLLAGSEVNIGLDGAPDYEDELLERLDWVICSVHTSFRISEQAMTERIEAAMEHPLVDCIGHLTGRLIGRREPYGLDIERLVAKAVETGTMLEINANPNRRDLSEHHARLAVDAGVAIVINTDAHGVDTLAENMKYGIATARRAWITAGDVANTLPWSRLVKRLKRPR